MMGDLDEASYKYMTKVVNHEHLYQIIKAYDDNLTNQEQFCNFAGTTNIAGKEKESVFRATIAKQFTYLHEHQATK